jgi:DNA modification methylase
MELKIKEEFKKLIPPLTPDEYKQLETNCIEEGIRDAIITWNGYIIDGHNRYKIAQDWQLSYNTIEKAFESEEYVKEWMIINQFGRRNLSNYDRAKLGLELKEILEYKAKLKESLRKSIQQTKAIDLENIKPEQKAIVEILSGYKKRAYATPDKIYFIQNEDKVKIGVSNDVESRLKDIKKHIPDCHLIGYCAGGIDLEKQIHNSLNECKLHNEWFKLNDLSITLIKSFVENCDFSDLRKVNSYKEASEKFKIGIDTIAKVKKIEQKATPEIKEKLSIGELTINQAYQDIKKEEKKEELKEKIQSQRIETKISENIKNGNCLQILESLEDGCIDIVLTDPPYGINYISNRSIYDDSITKRGLMNDGNEAFEILEKTCQILTNKVAQNAHLYFFCSWSVFTKFENIIGKYFTIKTPIVWDKGNKGSGDLENDWGNQTEIIIFCIKGKKLVNNRRGNLLSIPRLHTSKMVHPTQKPVELIDEILAVSYSKGDFIVDPFMGSGSTIKACNKLNAKSLGIEIDNEMFNIANTFINE